MNAIDNVIEELEKFIERNEKNDSPRIDLLFRTKVLDHLITNGVPRNHAEILAVGMEEDISDYLEIDHPKLDYVTQLVAKAISDGYFEYKKVGFMSDHTIMLMAQQIKLSA